MVIVAVNVAGAPLPAGRAGIDVMEMVGVNTGDMLKVIVLLVAGFGVAQPMLLVITTFTWSLLFKACLIWKSHGARDNHL